MFNSVEAPWFGLHRPNNEWQYMRQKHGSFPEALRAKIALCLFAKPSQAYKWIFQQSGLFHDNRAPMIVNTFNEARNPFLSKTDRWLEISRNTPGGFSNAVRFCSTFSADFESGDVKLVLDTLHLQEMDDTLNTDSARELINQTGLIHWQPDRGGATGEQSEIWQFLDGVKTQSVCVLETLLAAASLEKKNIAVVMEPSIYHWRQLAGYRSYLDIEWIKKMLVWCSDVLHSHFDD